jgi:excisionase family DNA binding protein
MTPWNGDGPAATGLVAQTDFVSPALMSLAAPADDRQPRSPYLTTEEAADFLHVSPWTIREMARLNQVPVRRPSGTRRLLFREDELREWIEGAELELVELPGGGRIVRPVGASR